MGDGAISANISGGQMQGFAGVGTITANVINFINRPIEEPPVAEQSEIGPCPYPGLLFFEPADAHLFFGRDAAIGRLAKAVERQSFTALVGASGSGKSSVALAGLAPSLLREGWLVSYFRVGVELDADAFLALARAATPLYVESPSDTERLRNAKMLATSLRSGELSLRDVFADCRARNKGKRILLIADQFEEVFTLIPDEAARRRFIDVLLAGFLQNAGGAPDICLVITMRADFFGRALLHRPLADALQGHVENLGPMNRDELKEAIIRPAENEAVEFESGLVETLLDEVVNRPGGLPLLQFALREMWGRQSGRKITRKSYDDIGGVEGALAQRAEAIYAAMTRGGLDAGMARAFRQLFTRLVRLGEGQEDTRRILARGELDGETWDLAQRLADEKNRLVVTNAPAPGRETVEVAHEALIRHWPRLMDWIDRDRAFLAWLNQIKPNVELWSAVPSDEAPLLRGGMLAQATDWLAKRGEDLSGAERGYIEASDALRQHAEAQKEAAARRLRRWLNIAAGAALAAFALFGAAIYFYRDSVGQAEHARAQTAEAQKQAAIARSNAMLAIANSSAAETALGVNESDSHPVEAAKLALAAWPRDADDPAPKLDATLDLLGKVVPQLRERVRIPSGGTFVVLSPDGTQIVTAPNDNTARIWDAGDGRAITILRGHEKQVVAAAFSPDGKKILTASLDKTARLWNAADGRELTPPLRHDDKVNAAAFSPDGASVATISGNSAHLWNAATGAEITPALTHEGGVNSVAFSPDGGRIVTASADKTARVWDAADGHMIATLKGHDGAVLAAAFSHDGVRVVTASTDKTARVWDAASGNATTTLTGHGAEVTSAAFSPDDKKILTASPDSTARLWTVADGRAFAQMRHDGWVTGANFSRDGAWIVTASMDKTARLWDAANGVAIATLAGHDGQVLSVALSRDAAQAVTISYDSADSSTRIWDVAIGRSIATLTGHAELVTSAFFSPDGKRVATASSDKTSRLWDVATGREIAPPFTFDSPATAAVFSPDGTRFVTGSSDGIVRIWDASTRVELMRLKGHQGAIASVAFSPNSTGIVTASTDGSVQFWNAVTGVEVGPSMRREEPVAAAAFSPDGKQIVTASLDKIARIWNAADGRAIAKLEGHNSRVMSAAFSPDGARIVTASADGTARIWDVTSAHTIAILRGHDRPVNSAVFSPDGERVLTASADATARIWDTASGRMIAILRGHGASVTQAAFNFDGTRVVTASQDKTARIWDVGMIPKGNILAVACALLPGKNLGSLVGKFPLAIDKPICGPNMPGPKLTELIQAR